MTPRAARWLDASVASPEALADLGIVVIGYGNQGRAQALNLRDSAVGRWIRVWARPGGHGAQRARGDGFELLATAELARGDLFLCLLPDEVHGEFVGETLTAALQGAGRPGRIVFAHGLTLAFTPLGPALRAAPWREVAVVAPSGPGTEVRAAFAAGWGVPAFLAVWHDVDGQAQARALALAHAIGATRAGVLETTVRDEAVVDLFGEQAVVCGGLTALMTQAFEILVAAGYPAEMAYLECVHQVRLTAELVHRHGIAGMRERISGTARYGDLTRGPRVAGAPERRALAEILSEIESGEFAAEWLAAVRGAGPALGAWRADRTSDTLEEAGREVRRRSFPPTDPRPLR